MIYKTNEEYEMDYVMHEGRINGRILELLQTIQRLKERADELHEAQRNHRYEPMMPPPTDYSEQEVLRRISELQEMNRDLTHVWVYSFIVRCDEEERGRHADVHHIKICEDELIAHDGNKYDIREEYVVEKIIEDVMELAFEISHDDEDYSDYPWKFDKNGEPVY